MTHDELRDELARAMGWTYYPDAISHINSTTMQDVRGVWAKGNPHESDNRNPSRHPVERTADAALAAFERLLPGWAYKIVAFKGEVQGTAWNAELGALDKMPKGPDAVMVEGQTFTGVMFYLTLAAVRAKGGADGK